MSSRAATGRPLPPRHLAIFVVAGLVALATSTAALLLGGGRPVGAPAGLPDPGAVAGWMLRGVRLVVNVAGCLTVGSLLVGSILVGSARDDALDPTAARATGAAGRWAAVWAAGVAALFVLTTSDAVGVPPTRLTGSMLRTIGSTSQGRALGVVAILALVVAVSAGRARTVNQCRALLVVALGALLPVPVTGHAASSADHDLAVSGLAVHVVAAALWVGGLAGLMLHVRTSPPLLGTAVRRFSVTALACYLGLAGSGLILAGIRLGTSLQTWTSGYGAVLSAKVVALVTLGVVGVWHRRQSVPGLLTGRLHPFVRLAGAELVLMGAAMGLATALARTPPPARPSAAPTHGAGHSTLPSEIEPVSLTQLLVAWRPNPIVLVVLAGALAAYLWAVRELGRSGCRWPRSRTAAFVAGVVLALIATCSGIATYAPAMVSVQIVQLLVVLFPVAALLAFGTPVTLWARLSEATGRTDRSTPGPASSRARRVLADPYTGAFLVCALLLVLYRSPLIETSLRSSWVHLLVLGLAAVSGWLLLSSVLATETVQPPSRTVTERVGCVAAVAACLALLAAQLSFGDRLLAGRWFLELRWSWVDPVADQRFGGAVIGATALVLILLSAAVAVRGRRDSSGWPPGGG